MSSLAFSSPLPSSARRPWRGAPRRRRPAPPRRSASSASSLPASIACSIRHRLTSANSLAVRIVEAALGHAHVQRHLAAFEAVDGDAGAGLLALHAATGGLALARARAAADAHALLGRPRRGASSLSLVMLPSPRRSAPELSSDSALICFPRTGKWPDGPKGLSASTPPPRPCARPWRSCRGRRGCPPASRCGRAC